MTDDRYDCVIIGSGVGGLFSAAGGTPSTNERFVFVPRGNAYGANLTPRQFNIGKLDYRTPYPNLPSSRRNTQSA